MLFKPFKTFIAQLTAIDIVDADQFYVRDVDGGPNEDATITAGELVSSVLWAGRQAFVNPLPPPAPVLGQMWLMTPENHAAMYSSTGWLPIYPPTDNEAVLAGNALLGPLGFWVAEDGD